ncbi:MAG: carbohydrate-binding domain-containing protein, partial [Candidatus Onthovivens sp.]|nr:carbohydrate-binding domain-containing protein [Candidatus Onthovivens sp.]
MKESGIYELSGYLKGAVEVSDSTDEIVLALNNVEIETLETQACAPLVFSKPKNSTISKRYVHLVENSINKLCDSEGDNATDGDGAVIQAKKRDLVINGKGQLLLEGKGEETSGIKAKTDLIIRDSTVNILSVNKSGIKADEKVALLNANIKIESKGDGIKTDLEPSTEEEALNYSSSLSNGYLYIENTSIDIVSGDD